MRTNVRIKLLLLYLSTTTITLYNPCLCVKSAITLDIDRVLQSYSNNIDNKIVKENFNNDDEFTRADNYPSTNSVVKRDVTYQTRNLNDFHHFSPSTKDLFLQEKNLDIHSVQGKTFLTNEIIPADLMTDGTFKLFGHNPFATFNHVLKQNEHIFKNTNNHPMRPGTVDDIKYNPHEEHGQHMAMDVHTYPSKPTGTFKAPDMTYEGFIPCSPPKCPRANSQSTIALTSKPITTSSSPYNVHKTTTIAPIVYKTTTRGLPLYNPPTPKPTYTKPTENTQNGFLVDFHPVSEASNPIEEPNLYKAQPSKGKHHHHDGYNNDFHNDEFGHQLVDLIKPDYKYAHHEEGVNSIHPDPHHSPNSTWIFHDEEDSSHPHSAVVSSHANDITTNSILDNQNSPHKENVGHQLVDLHIKDYKYIHKDAKKDEKKVQHEAPVLTNEINPHDEPRFNIPHKVNFGHQLIDLHIKDYNYIHKDTKKDETKKQHQASVDTHGIKTHKEQSYQGIDVTSSPSKEVIDLIKDDYHYVPPTGVAISTTHSSPTLHTIQYESSHAGTYPGHQLVDLIKDDYKYVHVHNDTEVPVQKSNAIGISTTAIYTHSPFGSIHNNFKPEGKGHQLVDLIKDDYQYVQTTAASQIHSNLPAFEKVEDDKTISQKESHGNGVDHQVIDLIKDDYKYIQDSDSPSADTQSSFASGITEGARLTSDPNQTPIVPEGNEFEPSFQAYGDDYGDTFLGDNYIDLDNSIQNGNSDGTTTTNSFNPSTKVNSQQELAKPLAAVSAVIQHTENRTPKSRPSVLVIHHDAPVHTVPLGTSGFVPNGVFQQTHAENTQAFRQEEQTNLGNHAFNILHNSNSIRENTNVNIPNPFIKDEHLVLSNNIPTATPPSVEATSNTVKLLNDNASTTIMKPNEIAALFAANDVANDIAAVNDIHHQDNLIDQMHNNIPFKTNHPFPPRLLSEFMQTQSVMKDVIMNEAVNSKPKPRRPKQIMPNLFIKKLPSMQHLRQLQQEFGKGIAHFPLWREDFRAMSLLRPSKTPDVQNSNFVHQSPIGRPIKFRRGMRPKFKKGLKKITKFKVHSITGQLVPVDVSIPQSPGTQFFTDTGRPIEQTRQSQQLRQGKQINAFRPASQVSHPSQFASPSETFASHQPFHGISTANRHPHKPKPPSSFAFISMMHGHRNKRRNHKHHV